jgi:hypothetical protein
MVSWTRLYLRTSPECDEVWHAEDFGTPEVLAPVERVQANAESVWKRGRSLPGARCGGGRTCLKDFNIVKTMCMSGDDVESVEHLTVSGIQPPTRFYGNCASELAARVARLGTSAHSRLPVNVVITTTA